jgi:polyhydroxybutyrate depolymerase
MLRRLFFASAVLVSVGSGASACGLSNVGRAASQPGASDGGGAGRDSRSGVISSPSKGCGGGAAQAVVTGLSTGLTLSVAGKDRSYDLSVPGGYDPMRAYRLVFVFHGGGGSAKGARTTFKLEGIAGDAAIFVYPQGLGDWDLDTPADANDDVAFFDAMLEELEGELCVDSARVFATGSSNGAYFANQLGCRRGARLRAIASHAGGGPYENDGRYDDDGHLICAGGTPPAALVVHGEADAVVAPSEGKGSVEHWRWANHCGDDTTPYSPAPCVAYGGCAAPVVWCRIPGLGHGVWEKGPQATWDFFASF